MSAAATFDPRLIPARAGKTEKAGIPASLGSAHPRAGGENGVDKTVSAYRQGSSPRGRGKLRSTVNR